VFRPRVHLVQASGEGGTPFRTCVAYCAVCLLWIFLSDRVLIGAHLPVQVTFWVGTIKGVVFVLATTGLLFILLKRDNEKIRQAHEATLQASLEIAHRLAHAIELRDVATCEHNERIAGYCRLVGEEMGLDAAQLDRLVRAAPLHDVGKIAIPDAILQKPGELTFEETEIVRKHAMLGAELLCAEGNPFMMLAATIARTHHEAWDGSGYPCGLKMEEIPLEGRIVAVCDVFDALLSQRPYKKAWTFDDAAGEILRLSGSKFDPQVVEAFRRALPKLCTAHISQPGPACLDYFEVATTAA